MPSDLSRLLNALGLIAVGRLDVLTLTAFLTFLLLALANIFSTLFLCGASFCPDAPTGYLI